MVKPEYVVSRPVYDRLLARWAARTGSTAEKSWKGPGTYRYSGYVDDDGRPVATLERGR